YVRRDPLPLWANGAHRPEGILGPCGAQTLPTWEDFPLTRIRPGVKANRATPPVPPTCQAVAVPPASAYPGCSRRSASARAKSRRARTASTRPLPGEVVQFGVFWPAFAGQSGPNCTTTRGCLLGLAGLSARTGGVESMSDMVTPRKRLVTVATAGVVPASRLCSSVFRV